ncbi:hypothetical protein OSB04_000141 [Centaurea solstitialis]|uniref:DUF7950 domain-containing protein n=1 Tax=Centaurea solstitialis TaxID=347529 RepID=A0AA38U087_9ASTR|nr:hypothetical protein OSB04_000141 [Centaurea solstitialis]
MAGGGGKNRRMRCGSGGVDAKDKMIINQIMLRFRPIAPRPVTSVPLKNHDHVTKKRAKRKYVRVKDKKWMKMLEGSEFVVTDLDPVVEKQKVPPPPPPPPDWISFDSSSSSLITPAAPPPALDLEKRGGVVVVESWITIESVTGTCGDERYRYSEDEILKDLEMDNCPGFRSNGYDEVEWVNLAYRRMVGGSSTPPEVLVWLELGGVKSIGGYWPPADAFSCRVRVVFNNNENQLMLKKKQMMMVVPCDVWKMDSGGYAWRLDVKAALSLGISCFN